MKQTNTTLQELVNITRHKISIQTFLAIAEMRKITILSIKNVIKFFLQH